MLSVPTPFFFNTQDGPSTLNLSLYRWIHMRSPGTMLTCWALGKLWPLLRVWKMLSRCSSGMISTSISRICHLIFFFFLHFWFRFILTFNLLRFMCFFFLHSLSNSSLLTITSGSCFLPELSYLSPRSHSILHDSGWMRWGGFMNQFCIIYIICAMRFLSSWVEHSRAKRYGSLPLSFVMMNMTNLAYFFFKSLF